MKYMKPLDSLRAIAVLLVIVWHWFPNGSSINKFPTGPAGVLMFFVLSGFLITRILLEGRNATDRTGIGKSTFLKNFYIRRGLRIFPIYYLLVIPFFLFALFNHQELHEYLYLLTYTSNIYFYKIEAWTPYFSHTWTLAVEEQFYLAWPLIILFLNKRFLLPCIFIFIITGITSQFIFGDASFGVYLTFSCFNSLGLGALLAWVTVYKPTFLLRFCKITGLISLVFIVLFFLEIFHWHAFIMPISIQLSFIALTVISYIVYTSYNGIQLPAILNFILNNSLLISLGKISYGVYLYHVFIPTQTWKIIEGAVFDGLPVFIKKHHLFFFVSFNFLILLTISTLSWLLIEKPILGLKKHFEIRDSTARYPKEKVEQNEAMAQNSPSIF